MKQKYGSLVLAAFLSVSGSELAASEAIDVSYGGTGKDGLRTVTVLRDGGYMLAGWLDQTTRDHFGVGYIVNLAPDGSKRWDKEISTNGRNRVTNVFEREDGGYLIAVEEFPAEEDPGQVVLLDLTAEGEIIGERAIGEGGPDIIEVMRKTPDGGYAFVGETASQFGGNYQGWIGKLSPSLDIEWQHRLGGDGHDRLTDCVVLDDGSIVAVGNLNQGATDGAIKERPWLMKVAADGEIAWSHEPVMDGAGSIRGIALAPDGGFALSGYVRRADDGEFNFWVAMATETGELVWEHTGAKPDYDNLLAVEPAGPGYYVAIGSIKSADTGYDALLVYFSETGSDIRPYAYEKAGTQFGRVTRAIGEGTIGIGGFNNADDGLDDQLWFAGTDLSSVK